MRSSKLSTIFLLLLMVFTLTMSVGCGKENSDPKDDNNENNPSEVVGNENDGSNVGEGNNDESNNGETKTDESNQEEPKKTVKLLKRNGVEWKENTKINSKKGAEKYTVVWGDTLSLIARTWDVNCYTLARYNGIKNIDLIEVDQVIYNYAYKK